MIFKILWPKKWKPIRLVTSEPFFKNLFNICLSSVLNPFSIKSMNSECLHLLIIFNVVPPGPNVIVSLHSFFFFNIYKLWIATTFFGKGRLMVPCCLLYSFEFKLVFFLNPLPSKTREPILPYYFTLIAKLMQQPWPEFKFSLLISFTMLKIIILPVHLYMPLNEFWLIKKVCCISVDLWKKKLADFKTKLNGIDDLKKNIYTNPFVFIVQIYLNYHIFLRIVWHLKA